jgi:histone H3/H4
MKRKNEKMKMLTRHKTVDDDESVDDYPTTDHLVGEEEEDELMSFKSINSEEDEVSVTSLKTDDTPDTRSGSSKPKAHKASAAASSSTNSAKKQGCASSVTGLTIPFRTVKKAMKLDPDIPIVQNEAAIMTTYAVELFLQRLAKESFRNAKNRGRNTVRYEDVAEARTSDQAFAFLEPLLP